jgi:hypothetical protein
MAIKLKKNQKVWVARVCIYKRHHEERGTYMSEKRKATFVKTYYGNREKLISFHDDTSIIPNEWRFSNRIEKSLLDKAEYGVAFNELTYGGNKSRNNVISIGRTQEEAEKGIVGHSIYRRYIRTKERVIERMKNDLREETFSMLKFVGVFDKYAKKGK